MAETTAANSAPLKGERVAILATDIPAFNPRMIEAIAKGAPGARMDRGGAEI